MRIENLDRLETVEISKLNRNYLHYKYLFADLKSAINRFGHGKILDIGCGNKPYKSYFNDYESYIGCDIIQSSRNEVDIISEATNIPLSDSYFDTIFTTQTIEHVFEHRKMVEEAYRLLKKNGYIIISGPMYWPHHEEPYDFYRFTKHGLRAILEAAGFEVIEIKSNGGKWPLWGVTTIQTLPSWITNLKLFKYSINSLCEFMDVRDNESNNTMNFVVVARK